LGKALFCVCLFLDLVDRFLRAYSSKRANLKLAKSRRYQGLLLLCLPRAHIIFYFPKMAGFVTHVLPWHGVKMKGYLK
jgi:hypothetical protein